MSKNDSKKDIICKTLGLEPANTVYKIENGKHEISGLDSNGEIKSYYIVDIDNISPDEVLKDLKSEDKYDGSIIIFENSLKEYEKKKELLKKRGLKSKYNEIFESSYVIYTETCDDIIFKIKEEENYLEYLNFSKTEGFIYNISYHDIKKLYDYSGNNIFENNIRSGLHNYNRTSNKIQSKIEIAFKKYFWVGIYNYYSEKCNKDIVFENPFDVDPEKFKKICKSYDNRLFWFCHNGITICTTDGGEKIRIFGNEIRLPVNYVNVVNGAQTLFNLRRVSEELKYDEVIEAKIKRLYEISDDDFEKISLKNAVEHVEKNLYIKTIFVNDSESYISDITSGLNTQIPIDDETLLTASKVVQTINSKLETIQFKITKPGEMYPGTEINILQLVKWELLIEGYPGKSKNFSKEQIENYLEKISKNINNDYLQKLTIVAQVDKLWNKENLASFNSVFSKYGKNYFCSYLVYNGINEITTNNFVKLFNQFMKDFNNLKEDTYNLSLEDFKKDTLFKLYKQSMENKMNNNMIKAQ